MVGIRESRNITTEYVLTGADLLSRKKFDDAFCQSNYPVDIHGYMLEIRLPFQTGRRRPPLLRNSLRLAGRQGLRESARRGPLPRRRIPGAVLAAHPALLPLCGRSGRHCPPPLRSMQKSPRAKLTAARSAKLWKTAGAVYAGRVSNTALNHNPICYKAPLPPGSGAFMLRHRHFPFPYPVTQHLSVCFSSIPEKARPHTKTPYPCVSVPSRRRPENRL